MKHAYLIMAHDDLELLNALIKCIDDVRNDIYLHIDQKSTLDLSDIVKPKYSSLILINRINVTWGGDSQIKCTMNLLEASYKKEYRYYHLLSGHDLPIKSQDEIHCFFEKNDGKNFLNFRKIIPREDSIERVKYFHLFQNRIGRSIDFSAQKLRILTRFFLKMQRLFHINRSRKLVYYKGSNWFSITNELVNSMRENVNFIKHYFYSTLGGDEFFLQTFVMNNDLATTVINDNLRCIDWERGSPYTWRIEDKCILLRSDKLFVTLIKE